jgi:16S rRNA (cytosine967-C5)-methyltransferase
MGNYRPRRRHGAPGNTKGPGATPRASRGTSTARAGSSGAPDASTADSAARHDPARLARRPRPADPRRTAYDVLAAVRDREAYANLLLPRLLAERQLTGRDAAFATELAYGTLRGQGSYDAVLAACSDRPLDKLDPPVLDVLRLGTHQLLNTRIGAHAAVATSVDLAKSVVGPRVSGYVNAVLRRVATRDLPAWLDIVAPDPVTDPDGYLATRYSHPRWIVAAYRDALGDTAGDPAQAAAAPDAGEAPAAGPGDPAEPALAPSAPEAAGAVPVTEIEAALAAGNARPRVTMATFPSGPPRDDVMPAGAAPGRWSPYAFTLESGNPASLVDSGAAAVQDEGSQLAAIALSRAPVTPRADGGNGGAERWLDLCAGPGGKSRLLLGLAAYSGATLTAAELHPHRAALVADTLTRASRPAGPAALPSGEDHAAPPSGEPAAPPSGEDHAAPPPGEDHAPPSGEPAPGPGATEPPGGPGADFEVVVADGTRPPWPDGAFDRVLVDAPCSGLGALRRRPEARWRKSQADLKELTALQRDLLRSALKSVRPGGVVAYVTCSPVPAETSDVIADVIASVPGTEVIDAPTVLEEVPGARSAGPLFAQLWPHRHGTDAIFIALLRRATQLSQPLEP